MMFLNGDIYYIGTNQDFTLTASLLGLAITFLIFYLAFKIDNMDEKKTIWKPILLFVDTPIALATGVSLLGNTIYSIGWWIGICLFVFAVILGFGGLYYSLKFGRKN